KRSLVLAAALALAPLPALAQQSFQFQQSPSRLDAAVIFNSATGAGNTTVTATLTGNAQGSIYVTMIEIEVGANAAVTGAGVVQACTTSGLSSNLTFEGDNSSLTTGQVKQFSVPLNSPLKANPATNFSVACSGLQSTQTVRVNIGGYIAP